MPRRAFLASSVLSFVAVAIIAARAAAAEPIRPPLSAEHAGDWQLLKGEWQWGDGVLLQEDPYRGGVAILSEPAVADFTLSVDVNIRPIGEGVRAAAILFRATGTRSFYWLHLDSQNDAAILVQSRPGDSWNAILRRRTPITADAWHTVRVTCRGPQITVTLDDQQILEAEDDALSGGRIGFGTSQGSVAFRNLSIEGAPLDDAPELTVDPAPFQVISRGTAAGPYQAFPDVCRTPDGDLLCVFYAGYGHVSLPNDDWPSGGRICYVRSSDEGRTWSKPKVVYDGPQDDRDPHIAAMGDGSLWCSFFRYRKVDEKIEHDVCLVGSTDGGKTWDTEPRMLIENDWAVSAPVREMDDGTRILGVYTADKNTAYGAVLRSTDKGATWSEPISIDPDSGVRLDAETDVVRLKDGRLLAALRGDRGIHMHYATSKDLGQTWSSVSDIGFEGHCPHLTRLSSGEILLTHRLPNTSLHIRRDEGATWQGPLEIDTVGGAYASTVELTDGSELVIYYEEGYGSAIRAARFRVTPDGIEKLSWSDSAAAPPNE